MTTYHIDQKRGTPTLYVDGEVTSPVLFGLSDFPGARANTAYAQKNIVAFAKAGIDLVATDTGLHLGWQRVTPFDPTPLVAELEAVLDANPRAKILLRLHMNPPYWWHRDHPEECTVYRTPEGDMPGIDNGNSPRLIAGDAEKHMRASFASLLWIKEASERLTLFLQALEDTPAGDALMAVQIAGGWYGEWHQWGTDVSAPMVARFKNFLKEKYKTEEALRAAWHDPAVTFETARFRPEVFRPGDESMYRDPQVAQDSADAQECIQGAGPDAILHFCRAVKAVDPRRLCGAFYGYFLGTGGQNMAIGGHLDIARIQAAEELDFLCGPFCYLERRRPENFTVPRALYESIRLSGKLWLTEMDQAPVGTEDFVGGDPAQMDKTVATLRRNVLQPLLAGHGLWFYDHRVVKGTTADKGVSGNPYCDSIYIKRGWWDSPLLMAEIGKLQQFAEKLTTLSYKPAADVLVVFDTASYYHRAAVVDADFGLHEGLFRAGVVFDSVYGHDLAKCEMERYKCVIFVNRYKVTPAEREAQRRLTQGRMRIYLGGYGYCDGDTIGLENAAATVGMTLKKTEAAAVVVGEQALPFHEKYTPRFAVDDPAAVPLAYFDNGEVAAARKGDDVYWPLPYMDADTAITLLTEAGVHRWCDTGEPVNAGYGYVAVNCQRAGSRDVHLPGGKTVTVETEGFETVLIDIETGEKVL